MNKHWKIKPLGELCQIELGKTPSRGNKSLWDENKTTNNVWLSIADLLNSDNNLVLDSKEYVSDKGAKICKLVKKGTLLVSFKLTLGRLAFVGRDLFTNEAIAALSIKNEKELSKYFLYCFLNHFDWNKATEGDIKIKGRTLNKEKLKEISIPVPPLDEQQRIVAILDEAFDAIAKAKENTEKNLQNAKELYENYLQTVFLNKGADWKEKKLGEVCEFRNGQAHEQHIDENGKYILINSKYISSNGETTKRTNNALSPLFIDDIAFVMSDVPNGKALAKCFLVDKDNTYTLNQRIGAIRSKIFDSRFLVYQFNRHKYLLSFNNGESQTNLRKNDILNCPLFLPPLDTQQAISQKLDALSYETKRLETIYQQKLDNLVELKKSILQKAFNGELAEAKV